MRDKQYDEVVSSLVEFVKRVSNDKHATPAEVQALPEVAKVLFDVTSKYAM